MMIKEICLIAMVALGLTLVIPGTNVKAVNPTRPPLGSHPTPPAIVIAAILDLKTHKDNPTQIHPPFPFK